jgi:nitrate/nitrite transporter NarK
MMRTLKVTIGGVSLLADVLAISQAAVKPGATSALAYLGWFLVYTGKIGAGAFGGLMVGTILGLFLQEKLKFGDGTFGTVLGIAAVAGAIGGFFIPLSGQVWFIKSVLFEQVLLGFMGLLILGITILVIVYQGSPTGKAWVDALGDPKKK